MREAESPLPLQGIRVLDLSNLLAGPMSTMYLGDFGAEVIKVEHPNYGDELRSWGYAREGVGLMFKMLNRNKRMITLNLGMPMGQEICRRLVERVDVVVENFRPGRLEAWGLGYEDLSATNPGVVMVRITGFGQTGPYSDRPGFGTLAEAFSGYAATSGFADRPPLLPGFGLADATTAIHAAFGVMVALRAREASGGRGQFIDIGLYESLFTLLGSHVIDYDQLGIVGERAGSRLPFVAPRNTYRTRDGAWIAIAGATQTTFERIARALGLEDILADPDFEDNRARLRNVDKLDEVIGLAIAELSFEEISERFGDLAAPVGPVYDIEQIFGDPHYAARANISAVNDDELGRVRMQSVVPKLSGTPGQIARGAGRKGSDNGAVFGELGCTEEEIGRLQQDGVI